jgi:GNAT superfamily N-acetyltransferase
MESFTHRIATTGDIPAISALMRAAIGELQRGFLSDEQIAASRLVMGLDTQLIADGTYLVVEAGAALAGCGGWSQRATLFGGDHTPGREPALLDPAKDAARIRAMYTAPGFTRRGVARLILGLCETAASAEGFRAAEMAATLAGEPLYLTCGYREIERFTAMGGDVPVPLIRMRKALAG